MQERPHDAPSPKEPRPPARGTAVDGAVDQLRRWGRQQVHRRITLALQALLLLGIGFTLWQGQWLTALTTAAILAVTLFPVFLKRYLDVFIPPEIEVLAVVFVFASLFLGEVRGYYVRFWWWDAVLHAASGFLLGILGFLLVYVLNEKEDIDLHMKPGFVALFAFMFAVGLGALWEIFEFAMDSGFGLNMQKSGLRDTMWDLVVDAAGALVIAVLGYSYLQAAPGESFLGKWILHFIERNPRFFQDAEDGRPPRPDSGPPRPGGR